MNLLSSFPSDPVRRGRKILARLERELGADYRSAVARLHLMAVEPALVNSLGPVLTTLSELRVETRALAARLNEDHFEDVYEQLTDTTRQIEVRMQTLPDAATEARHRLTHIVHVLIAAEHHFRAVDESRCAEADDSPVQVQVPTDLLYKCHHSLFPAERMIVVAGRRRGRQIVLGADFDVTGAASAGHVRADPRKLGQALIDMSSSESHLAAWFHSHPGSGPFSTGPSGTDLKQHCDWLRDYSPRLLSGIFVKDGYLRFWGSGLDEGKLKPVLIGSGIAAHEGDERHVYKIVPG